jgi:hypothetical protein
MSAEMKRWFKQNSIWVAAFVFVCILAFAEARFANPSLKEALGWAGTLVSTFVGAALAFIFNAIRSRREREDQECAAGNLALITLIELLDRLLQYQNNYVNKVRGKADAWFAMRAGELTNVELKIDKNALPFLLEKHPMTWRAIVLEETRFSVFGRAVEHRNKLINEKVWPTLEARGYAQGSSIKISEIEEVLGPATTQDLKNVTEHIVENCEKDISSLNTCIANLRKALLELYPAREFIRLPKKLA